MSVDVPCAERGNDRLATSPSYQGEFKALTFQSSLRETYSQIRRRYLRAFNGTGV